MLDSIKNNAEERMQKSVVALKNEFNKVRTSRAHPNLLEHVIVAYYGTGIPLSQVATVNVSDAQTLTITPWDKGAIPHIEKAILKADLGLNPISTGDVIRVPMPALNEERRKEFVKLVKSEAEQARIAIRNIRREVNNELKKQKQLTEDDERRIQDLIQKLTNKYIELVDKALADKEKDLLAV